jgi:hypothetical protein
MLIYLDLIADKKLKAPSPDDASRSPNGHVYATSNASIRTAGGLSVEKRASIGQLDGRVPLGGVIPVIGTYSATNNTGTFTTATGIPGSGVISDDGFMRCNGVEIPSGQDAKLSGFTPQISDERFIQGSTTAGFATVENLSLVNRRNNFVRLTDQELPNHNHGGSTTGSVDLDHTHSSSSLALESPPTAGGYDFDVPGAKPISSANITTGGSGTLNHTHTISGQGNNTPFDIRPKYINAIYLIRVR